MNKQEEDMIKFMKENLELEAGVSENYTGDMEVNGLLYEKSFVVRLKVAGEIISEAYLD